MFRFPMTIMVTLLLALMITMTANAETYISPRGFSLEYPDHWSIASKELLAQSHDEVRNLDENFREFDFDRVAVAILDPTADDFATNVNVVTGGEVFAKVFAKLTPDEAAERLKEELPRLGLKPETIEGTWSYFGQAKVLTSTVQWTASLPGATLPLVQRQYYFFSADDDSAFIMTCTTLQSRFTEDESTFEAIAESFRMARIETIRPGI